jgi:hypothetical protein
LKNLGIEQYKDAKGKIITKRFSVPYFDSDGEYTPREERGRPYVFELNKFLTPEDLEQYEIPEHNETPDISNAYNYDDIYLANS